MIADGRKRRSSSGQLIMRSSADPDPSGSDERPSLSVTAPTVVTTTRVISVDDQINKAETILVLKAVESQWSYNSFDNLADILRKADPDSKIFANLKLKSNKASYMVSSGLGPYFKKKIISAVQRSVGFTLLTDSATFHQKGVSKHVDLVFQFWDEERNEVRVEFFDFHSVGHEPADLQVKNIQDSLKENDISLVQMVAISRDDPKVMQAVLRKLKEVAEDNGNLAIIDLPCFLHPTPTSFQKAVQALDEDIPGFLVRLHSFFKLSTARREDRNIVQEGLASDLGEEFEEVLDRFFLRHVSTRWLEMGPVVERGLELWLSTKKYFLDFLPNSKVQSNKKSVETKWYKQIAAFLAPEVEKINLARLKWVLCIARACKPFLIRLQTRRPLIHELHDQCNSLFMRIAQNIMKPEMIPKKGKDIAALDLRDSSLFLNSDKAGYMDLMSVIERCEQ